MSTVAVEAWCDLELYVWILFGGQCGTESDKSLPCFSRLFTKIVSGVFNIFQVPSYSFRPSERYGQWNVFGDGNYREWPIYVRLIPDASLGPRRHMRRKNCKKEIDRLRSVVQGRFRI